MIFCLIVIGILALLGVISVMSLCASRENLFNGAWAGCLFVAFIILFFFGLFAIISLTGNYGQRVQLEVFYTENTQNYADTVNMSNNILLQAKFTGGLTSIGEGLAYQEQSAEVTKAIVEWRNAVNQYNKDLANYKAWQSNPWTSWFYYHTDAEYLSIK